MNIKDLNSTVKPDPELSKQINKAYERISQEVVECLDAGVAPYNLVVSYLSASIAVLADQYSENEVEAFVVMAMRSAFDDTEVVQ